MNRMKINKTIQTAILAGGIMFFGTGCATLYIKSGKEAFENLQYQDAIFYLEKGISKKDDPEGRRMLAESYLMTNNYQKANELYELTSTNTDNTDKDRVNYARSLMSQNRYADAKPILEGILSRDPGNTVAQDLLNSCKKYNEMKKDSLAYIVVPENIPAPSVYSSYPYKDGYLVTSPSGKGDKDPYTNRAFTNLFYTQKNGNQWSTPVELEGVNGKFHDAVGAVSPNGQTMIFTRSFQLNSSALAGNDNKTSTTQLYMSKANPDGTWSKPSLVAFCESKYMYAHPFFSPDGGTMYFASDMPGGQGGMDIWKSKFNGESWDSPMNLGGNINTKGDEVFPTLKDAETLYFSSDAHQTLGGLDINAVSFANGNWGIPKHLSYPINTSSDDFSMVWNADGKTGLFSSDRNGNDRIYSFTEEDRTITYRGLITGKDSMLPLGGVKVTIRNLTDGTEQMVMTDGNGKFEAELEKGKEYQITSEVDGHFKKMETISTVNTKDDQIQGVIELEEIYIKDKPDVTDNGGGKTDNGKTDNGKTGNGKTGKESGVYDIPEIHWDYNKWDIRDDAIPYLDRLVKLFRENNNLKFELRSHTDCRGSLEYNDDLSQKRAKAVTDYLVKKGVSRGSLVSKGYGERELLNDCTDGVFCDESKHEQNRRTEFIVTGKK
jgi:peptidoglycan-associated lipoprotein